MTKLYYGVQGDVCLVLSSLTLLVPIRLTKIKFYRNFFGASFYFIILASSSSNIFFIFARKTLHSVFLNTEIINFESFGSIFSLCSQLRRGGESLIKDKEKSNDMDDQRCFCFLETVCSYKISGEKESFYNWFLQRKLRSPFPRKRT